MKSFKKKNYLQLFVFSIKFSTIPSSKSDRTYIGRIVQDKWIVYPRAWLNYSDIVIPKTYQKKTTQSVKGILQPQPKGSEYEARDESGTGEFI